MDKSSLYLLPSINIGKEEACKQIKKLLRRKKDISYRIIKKMFYNAKPIEQWLYNILYSEFSRVNALVFNFKKDKGNFRNKLWLNCFYVVAVSILVFSFYIVSIYSINMIRTVFTIWVLTSWHLFTLRSVNMYCYLLRRCCSYCGEK